LLIAKSLEQKELNDLYNYARSLDLEVLVEIHDKEDLKKALNSEANIIGINHRNLKTFEMDMNLCDELIPIIPKEKIIVAESGVSNKDVIKRLHSIGADAFLIGEHFMRVSSIKDELVEFKNSLK
ncbi:MAG: indole-3-glycerol-phosphate synthase TrpC, partial [Aliarcobacter sp.]